MRTLGVRTKKVLQVAGSHDRNSSSLTTHRGQPNRTRTVRRRLSSAVHYGPESLSTIDGISIERLAGPQVGTIGPIWDAVLSA